MDEIKRNAVTDRWYNQTKIQCLPIRTQILGERERHYGRNEWKQENDIIKEEKENE